jgi:dTDP-4-dehydrorhamnose 3,5-epimerase
MDRGMVSSLSRKQEYARSHHSPDCGLHEDNMIFRETTLKGAYIIEPERREDSRGFFARVWCRKEFLAEGLNGQLVQSNISYNKEKGTLRGMHYQVAPFAEIKLVRCTMGAIYDVIIDLRPQSPTYLQWVAVELTAENRKMLYVPENFAHGYQTLVDDAEVFYQGFWNQMADGGAGHF